jgi:hypothetical protein
MEVINGLRSSSMVIRGPKEGKQFYSLKVVKILANLGFMDLVVSRMNRLFDCAC